MRKVIGIVLLSAGLIMAAVGFWGFAEEQEPNEISDGMRYKVVNVEEGHGWMINMGYAGLLMAAVGAGALVIKFKRK